MFDPVRLAVAVAIPVLASTLAACGTGERSGPAVPEVARPIAQEGEPSAAAPVDASQPKDLAIVMRLRKPEETLDATSFVSGTPLSILLAVVSQIEQGRVLKTVDLGAHFDAAVSVRPGTAFAGSDDEEGAAPEPLAAFTFGVSNADGFIAALPNATSSRPRRDGTIRVTLGDSVCAVPSVGAAAARVLCGSSEEAVRHLGPWLTRTLVREPLPAADVRWSFFAEPARDAIRTLVAKELREESLDVRESLAALGITDPELLGVPDAVLDEVVALAEDSDRIDADVDLDPTARTVTARLAVRFRGTSAWVTRVLADPSERRGIPPAIFWRAPKDADAASWALASSPKHFVAIRRVASKSISIAGARGGLTQDETSALVAVVDSFPAYGGPWVSAQGHLPWKAPPKGKATPQNALADFKDRARAFLGWGMVGVEMPAVAWIGWVEAVDKAWRKTLAGVRRTMPSDTSASEAPQPRIVRGPPGFPRGSVALDFVMNIDSELAWSTSPRLVSGEDGMKPPHPPGPPARSTITFRLVIVPDGDRTFLAWSLDSKALEGRVKAALRSSPESGTIASRTDLSPLARPGTGGGFFTLRSWADLALEMASSEEEATGPELAIVREAIGKMPHRGETAVLTLADGTPGATPSLTFEMLVQEGTVDDLRALGQFAMGKGLRELILGAGAGSTTPVAIPVPPSPPPPANARP